RTGSFIHGRIDAEHVRSVHNVECFCKQFEVHRFRNVETLRKASIDVLKRRQTERVATQYRKEVAAERTVQARAGNRAAVRSTRIDRNDRRDRPAVQQVIADRISVSFIEVRSPNGTRDEFMTAVEVTRAYVKASVKNVIRAVRLR